MSKEEKQLSKNQAGKKQRQKGGKRDSARGPYPNSASSQDYVVGEVLSSLCQTSATNVTSGRLSSLFSTVAPAVQPVFVPVPPTARKRKEAVGEDGTGRAEGQYPAGQQLSKRPKVNREKILTGAERRVAERERALASADDDEKKELQKRKGAGQKKAAERIPGRQGTGAKEGGEKQAKFNRAEERIQNKRTIFVGNLPVTFTKQMLKALFKDFGAIESVRFRSLARTDSTLSRKIATIQRQTHAKRNNINAYVVFCDQAAATKALARNGLEVAGGFHIRVDLAAGAASPDNRHSVFVGNLPYEAGEEALRELFSDCGQVAAVRIIRDRDSGMGKGFGYVLFKDIDAVQLALGLDGSDLLGRKLRIKRCVRKEKVVANPSMSQVTRKSSGAKTGFRSTKLQPANHSASRVAKLGKNNKKTRKPGAKGKKGDQTARQKTQA
ncbi:RNA-binding protein 34-like [Rhinatrema bivittatum]|uniref:RNA-binding protein 34-like n=1 Tax=Rhinatrema bivittatum TaxID=194408 RepID=UPI00112CBDB8|nr:RNA-binding protein 34-like [Rhinatrema bivittatum]